MDVLQGKRHLERNRDDERKVPKTGQKRVDDLLLVRIARGRIANGCLSSQKTNPTIPPMPREEEDNPHSDGVLFRRDKGKPHDHHDKRYQDKDGAHVVKLALLEARNLREIEPTEKNRKEPDENVNEEAEVPAYKLSQHATKRGPRAVAAANAIEFIAIAVGMSFVPLESRRVTWCSP